MIKAGALTVLRRLPRRSNAGVRLQTSVGFRNEPIQRFLSVGIPSSSAGHENVDGLDHTADRSLATMKHHHPQEQSTSVGVGGIHHEVSSEYKRMQREEYLRMTVDRCLRKIPVGSMDQKLWDQSRAALFKLTAKETPQDCEEAMAVLKRLIAETKTNPNYFVNVTMFNSLMHGWARSGDPQAPHRAEEVYALLQQCADPTRDKKGSFHFTHQRSEIYNHEEEEPTKRGGWTLAPDEVTYHTLMHAWAESGLREGPERVEALLQEIIGISEADRGGSIHPTERTYNLVILAHANQEGVYGSAKKAEDWLLRLAQLGAAPNAQFSPDAISFNIVLKAWSQSDEDLAPARALEILRLMMTMYEESADETLKPNEISMMTVTDAFAKRGMVTEAMAV